MINKTIHRHLKPGVEHYKWRKVDSLRTFKRGKKPLDFFPGITFALFIENDFYEKNIIKPDDLFFIAYRAIM